MLKYLSFLIILNASVINAYKECNIVNCLIDPCIEQLKNRCLAYPDAVCVPNYCEGCNFDWIFNGCKINCNDKCCNTNNCEKGETVNCEDEPCRLAKCLAHPDAICKDNYCGGCFADFYVNDKKVIC